MFAFTKFAERTAAALRTLATGAPAVPAQTLSNKFLKVIAGADKSKPYKILVRGADGELVSKLVTREEFDAYIGNDRTWRRIA